MFEIYFSDLNKEAQEALLEQAKITKPEDANWDVFPIATIDVHEDGDDNDSHGGGDDNDDGPFYVCESCLAAIECHEGRRATRLVDFDVEYDENGDYIPGTGGKCVWCGEDGFDSLYEILD